MHAEVPSTAGSSNPVPYGAAKARVVAAALDLFTEQGISGTSLQMIADAVGVTKAAVYHQFPTKEEIVVATVEVELARLGPTLDAAEAEPDHVLALDLLLTQVIDLAVGHRRMVVTLQHDPVVVRLLAEHAPFQQFMQRLFRILTGDDASPAARVRAAMVSTAIGGAVSHPLVAGLDDDTLRSQLHRLAGTFLGGPD